MRLAPFSLALAVLAAGAARAGAPAGEAKPDLEMESFQLVLLVRAPTWKKLPDDAAQALQAKHIAHLTAMGESGKMVVAGPFGNQRDPAFRGGCIYRVATPEEARELAERDPAIQAGQLRAEVMTWWVGKGIMTFPRAPATEAGKELR